MPRPIACVASSITSGNSSKLLMDLMNDFNLFCSWIGRSLSGVMEMVLVDSGERRRIILARQYACITASIKHSVLTSVANLVHRFSFLGKGISVMASSTDDLPED